MSSKKVHPGLVPRASNWIGARMSQGLFFPMNISLLPQKSVFHYPFWHWIFVLWKWSQNIWGVLELIMKDRRGKKSNWEFDSFFSQYIQILHSFFCVCGLYVSINKCLDGWKVSQSSKFDIVSTKNKSEHGIWEAGIVGGTRVLFWIN